VVEAELFERGLERAASGLLAVILDPKLGRDKQLVACDPARGDRAADRLFVLVGGGGVERAVAGDERLADRLLGVRRRDLIDAEAEDRHLDAVVQRDGRCRCGFHAKAFSRSQCKETADLEVDTNSPFRGQ
jgi:hypothetical protein